MEHEVQSMAGINGATVAVVEDDAELRDQILVPILNRAGFKATAMASALDLYRAMTTDRFDLVVLDIGLPDDNGISIAEHLRGLSPSTGIVTTTGLDSEQVRLQSLRAGADAYLPKPVNPDELVMTLSNLARRCAQGAQKDWIGEPKGWMVSANGWRLQSPSGDMVVLTLSEREMVKMLVAARGAIVSRDALIAHLLDDDGDFDQHRLGMLVFRLRQKCRQVSETELPLKAMRGSGYSLVL